MKFIKIFPSLLLCTLPFTAAAQLGTWNTSVAGISLGRADGAAVGLNGQVYALGGGNYSCSVYSTLQVYNPASNAWITLAPMPTPRYEFGAAVLNGLIYAVGGNPGCGTQAGLNVFEAYNPVANTWTTTNALPPNGGYGSAVASANGKLYVIGGSANPNAVYAYDPSANAWATMASFPANNLLSGVAVVNGIIYVIGGSGSAPAAVYAYNPATDSWTNRASMLTPRYDATVGVINGIIYVAGGGSPVNGQHLTEVEAYDPQADAWSTNAPLPFPLIAASGAAVNGTLYAIGGYDTSNETLTNVEAFTLAASPILNVASSGGQTALYWPASFTNYVLQTTTNLASPNWVAVTNGTPNICITVTNTVPSAFFRLQPQ